MIPGPPIPFFEALATVLRTGARSLPSSFLRRRLETLNTWRDSAGRFTGLDRKTPDLYYTAFGFRCLELAGTDFRRRPPAQAFFAWLEQAVQDRELNLTDLVSLAEIVRITGTGTDTHPARRNVLLAESARTILARHALSGEDGTGFARVPGGPFSTYGTFLAVAVARGLDVVIPLHPAAVRDCLLAMQRPDGGFAESAMTASAGGASPTSAALTALRELGDIPKEAESAAADFLANLQTAEGGFKAHVAAPGPDLLSTFTALTALAVIDAVDRVRRGSAARYVRSLLRPDGNFAPTEADTRTDVEYLYYGMGALALAAATLR